VPAPAPGDPSGESSPGAEPVEEKKKIINIQLTPDNQA
jgi:hypothetical protein